MFSRAPVTQPAAGTRFRRELGALLLLAIPVVLSELGWMAMSIVDTIMVGRLSPAAIGAVGISSAIFYAPALFGIGLLLAGPANAATESPPGGTIGSTLSGVVSGATGAVSTAVPVVTGKIATSLPNTSLATVHNFRVKSSPPYEGTEPRLAAWIRDGCHLAGI